MTMAWQTPKTDWAVHYDANGDYTGDYFNASDFNRIGENLSYLADEAESLRMHPSMPDIPTLSYSDFGKASYINALERGIDALLAAGVVNTGVPATKTWLANSAAPLYTDINRLEASCATLKGSLDSEKENRPKLPISLGKEMQF
jgi:hypothetical protein